MSDVISHAILPGIVVAFFITHDLSSPLLIIAAAATGVLSVFLIEIVKNTKLVKEDAAMGLVFPILFSIGVIMITRFAGDVHLDTDAVLLGEIAFAPFNRFAMGGVDLGPKAMWVMGVIFFVNLLFSLVFYKELKISTFDAGLAASLGFVPVVLHYVLMALVSVTAVGAFDAVGSILVVALMIGPPATAYLLTHRLSWLLLGSIFIGAIASLLGYWLAHWLNVSIAGSMASVVGLIFLVTFLVAPDQGFIANILRRVRQKWEFAEQMLVIHLSNHEGVPGAENESRIEHLHEHISWKPEHAKKVVDLAVKNQSIIVESGRMLLTDVGKSLAQKAKTR